MVLFFVVWRWWRWPSAADNRLRSGWCCALCQIIWIEGNHSSCLLWIFIQLLDIGLGLPAHPTWPNWMFIRCWSCTSKTRVCILKWQNRHRSWLHLPAGVGYRRFMLDWWPVQLLSVLQQWWFTWNDLSCDFRNPEGIIAFFFFSFFPFFWRTGIGGIPN